MSEPNQAIEASAKQLQEAMKAIMGAASTAAANAASQQSNVVYQQIQNLQELNKQLVAAEKSERAAEAAQIRDQFGHALSSLEKNCNECLKAVANLEVKMATSFQKVEMAFENMSKIFKETKIR